jgi:hypothetical protein
VTRTTHAPSHDVAAAFPELAARARRSVRLHPRLGPEPPIDATKLGGQMGWPRDAPWPRCALAHDTYDAAASFPQFVAPPDDRPLVAVLQLRRDDMPEIEFAEGSDVLQLMWCPASHPELYAPAVRVEWWNAHDLALVDPPAPLPSPDGANYLPRPCSVHPEPVVEYPDIGDLDEFLAARVQVWEGELDDLDGPAYQYLFSTAPGTKVGGHPNWHQDPQWPTCAAGHEMDHLLTVSDSEFDGGTWPRWLPVEDAGVWDGPVQARFDVQGAIGIDLGMGSLYVFICRACADWPIAQVYQR